MSARRVVTLPPGWPAEAQLAFAEQAKAAGAGLLELRSDLHGDEVEAAALAKKLPLLVSERARPLPTIWIALAAEVDRPLPAKGDETIRSFHSPRPLTTAQALKAWADIRPGRQIKHVEPLGDPRHIKRLFETQARLGARFGQKRVTVLATGPYALPFRAVLAAKNAFDYLALGSTWAAAEGQRLLADAVRADRLGGKRRGLGSRRGVLGTGIAHSRSPRVHRQPFDRIDWPESADLAPLLAALHPHYEGFAVTAPFKLSVAKAIRSKLPAVNTLVRRRRGWSGHNTDVVGARAVLEQFHGEPVTVLGDGGATAALRLAAVELGAPVRVVRRAEAAGLTLSGRLVWTWPAALGAPENMKLREADVAIIAYGRPGRRLAGTIRWLGGVPLHLGPRWFVAQARAQRVLWEDAG